MSNEATTVAASNHELAPDAALSEFLAKPSSAKLSRAVLDILAKEGLDEQELRNRSVAKPSAEVLNRQQPLSAYLISSSHNTYLKSNQLTGKADIEAYKTVLKNGGRCVELDAWDGDADESPVKITHGYTFTSWIALEDVCRAIVEADDQDQNALPIIISLECHCSPARQEYIVKTFNDIFGDRLMDEKTKDADQLVLQDVLNKILIKVEFHGKLGDTVEAATDAMQGATIEEDSSSSDSDTEESKEIRQQRKKKAKIIKPLHDLGVYTLSVKPKKDDFLLKDPIRPPTFVTNISESALGKVMADRASHVAEHASNFLMRIYPHGLRITSKNLNPLPFWRAGCQIVALNWQTFDLACQLNTALFSGTHGWYLKQSHRPARPDQGKEIKLKLTIKAASGLVKPDDALKSGLNPFVTVNLFHSTKDQEQVTKVVKPSGENAEGCDAVFDEALEFTYTDEDLIFIRFLITHKDQSLFSRNDDFALAPLLLDNLADGWRLVKLLDLDGRATDSTLLVHVERS